MSKKHSTPFGGRENGTTSRTTLLAGPRRRMARTPNC